MHRRLVVALALTVSATPALAEEPESASTLTEVKPGQLLGAHLGVEAGGRVTPGGLRIGGSFLYRVSDIDWLDSSVGFTFGSGDPNCFRDRQDDVVCEHGVAGGFAIEAAAAVRRNFNPRGRYLPFFRLGLALRIIGFSDDEVTGLGVPLLGSGGVKAAVHEKVSVLAMTDLRIGWSFFNRGLGAEPHASFALSAGVEFDID